MPIPYLSDEKLFPSVKSVQSVDFPSYANGIPAAERRFSASIMMRSRRPAP